MKRFYSCLDAGFVSQLPQPVQHLANGDQAAKAGGKVIFYTAEDFESLKSQGVIRAKVEEKPEIEGIVFFRLYQFCYGGAPNFALMRRILSLGYELHFARENVSLPDLEALERFFPLLYSFAHLSARDGDRRFWQPIWAQLD